MSDGPKLAWERHGAGASVLLIHGLGYARWGWEPVLPGAGGPVPGGPQLRPDWPALFGQQQALLDEYQSIFGD